MSSAPQYDDPSITATVEPTAAPVGGGVLAGYLPPEELSAELDVSTRTLERWHKRRIGPPRIKIGRLVLYRREAVAEWLRTHEQNFEELKSARSWRKTRRR